MKKIEGDSYRYPVKFVYTVSDIGDMIKLAIKSIKSLHKFVDKNDIIVFYTPPRSEQNYNRLSKLAIVKNVPNITKPFVCFKDRGPGRYGEKIHLCDVDCSNVVFLDADTIVKKNPLNLLHGDYDFSARPAAANCEFDKAIWENMFKKFGVKPILMPNAGFMIFKNYCHRDIKDLWLELINNDLPRPHSLYYHKEQYALALALAIKRKRIRWMKAYEHAYLWKGEGKIDTYVLHGRTKLRRRLIPKNLRKLWVKLVKRGKI